MAPPRVAANSGFLSTRAALGLILAGSTLLLYMLLSSSGSTTHPIIARQRSYDILSLQDAQLARINFAKSKVPSEAPSPSASPSASPPPQAPPGSALISVVIPHFKNIDNLLFNLKLHQRRASFNSRISYHVVTGEDDQADRDKTFEAVGDLATVHELPQPGRVGGAALPLFFKRAMEIALADDSDVLSLVDVDAFILVNGWDERLDELLAPGAATSDGVEPPNVLAGINPRSYSAEFANVAEWNWMAMSVDFYKDRLPDTNFNMKVNHDWGHWFTKEALAAEKGVHLWAQWKFYVSGKSPHVCGDDVDFPFVLHTFFSTRKVTEKIDKDSQAYQWILSDAGWNAMLDWVNSEEPLLADMPTVQ